MNINKWVDTVRGKLHPETYVDFHAIPDPPEGPYRARVPSARFRFDPDEFDVSEPEIVQGDLRVLYVTRCYCGRRWATARFETIANCPNCGRVVVVTDPGSVTS
jgi:hypothetical protein